MSKKNNRYTMFLVKYLRANTPFVSMFPNAFTLRSHVMCGMIPSLFTGDSPESLLAYCLVSEALSDHVDWDQVFEQTRNPRESLPCGVCFE